MPLFDLRCNDCKEEFTKLVSYAKLTETECPNCSGQNNEGIFKATVKGRVTTNFGGSSTPTSGFT